MTRHKLSVFVMPLLAVGALVSVAAVTPDTPSPKLAAQLQATAWVKAHPASLNATLASYSSLSKYYRKALYHELSTNTKRNLWREHLQTFLTPSQDLSPLQQSMVRALGKPLSDTQLALIRSAVDSLARIWDTTMTLAQRQAVAKGLCDSAAKIFNRTQQTLIFGMVGPLDSSFYKGVGSTESKSSRALATLGPGLVQLVRAAGIRAHILKPTETRGFCMCHSFSACNCLGGQCSLFDCPPGYNDCGCFGIWWCDADCTYVT